MRDGCESGGGGFVTLSRTIAPAHGPGVHVPMPMLDYGRTHHAQESGKRGSADGIQGEGDGNKEFREMLYEVAFGDDGRREAAGLGWAGLGRRNGKRQWRTPTDRCPVSTPSSSPSHHGEGELPLLLCPPPSEGIWSKHSSIELHGGLPVRGDDGVNPPPTSPPHPMHYSSYEPAGCIHAQPPSFFISFASIARNGPNHQGSAGARTNGPSLHTHV